MLLEAPDSHQDGPRNRMLSRTIASGCTGYLAGLLHSAWSLRACVLRDAGFQRLVLCTLLAWHFYFLWGSIHAQTRRL